MRVLHIVRIVTLCHTFYKYFSKLILYFVIDFFIFKSSIFQMFSLKFLPLLTFRKYFSQRLDIQLYFFLHIWWFCFVLFSCHAFNALICSLFWFTMWRFDSFWFVKQLSLNIYWIIYFFPAYLKRLWIKLKLLYFRVHSWD